MGFILLGILASALVMGLDIIRIKRKKRYTGLDALDIIVSVMAASCIMIGFGAGLMETSGEYKHSEEIETIKLVNLNDGLASTGDSKICYVTIGANNSYTYYTEIESEFAKESAKAYVSRTISGDNIIVVEENCIEPRLVIYKEKSKPNFWTFSLGNENTRYTRVFYVPTGTIREEYSLGGKS